MNFSYKLKLFKIKMIKKVMHTILKFRFKNKQFKNQNKKCKLMQTVNFYKIKKYQISKPKSIHQNQRKLVL